MSISEASEHSQAVGEEDNYLTHSRGILSWLFTLDHKRIGIMYLISITAALFLGGFFALLVRTELFAPGRTIVSPELYNQLFTLHGAVMVFLFIIPGIPASLGNFVLPVMLGAKDVAFPRLNLFSYYLWLFGAIFFVGALLAGGLDTGWTFYTPYSTATTAGGVVWAATGVFILGFSSIFTGMNFLVTIHKLRPPGMSWFRMPLFLWGLYATGIMQILATPVLGITVALLFAERVMGIGIFDPALGGDPVLFQHFFWFYSHPAVYIMILPAMGVISELITAHSRKHIFGYKFIAFSSLAIAIIGFLVWGHHLFVSGQSALAGMIFSALTMLVAIPSAVKVFNWITTMYKGSIKLDAPMIFAMGFIWVFGIGGLTGLFLATISTDVHLHDTYFVVAHFHYVMVGGTIFAFLGGVHHWWPKMLGRMYHQGLARFAAILLLIGFNLAHFPQFIMGSRGMPRRYYDYSIGGLAEFEIFHQLSTIGAFINGIAILLMVIYLVHSIRNGKKAPANPWGANTLEWHCSSPPPHHNFEEAPTADDPYHMDAWVYDKAIDGYVLKEEKEAAASAEA